MEKLIMFSRNGATMYVKLIQKLKEDKGGGYIYAAITFLFFMIVMSVAVEYLRINLVANGIRDAYEKAINTVAVENYNDVYSGIREEDAVGGVYTDGGEGKWSPTEYPLWEITMDKGAVKEELTELLDLTEENGVLLKLLNNKKQYELSNFKEEVRSKYDSKTGKYEIEGNTNLTIPFYFSGLQVSEIDLPIKVRCIYTPKY